MIPIDNLLAALREQDCKPRRSDSGWKCRCPAHDDRNPSLSMSEGEDGRVLLHCFAGCSVESIAKALGLTLRDLYRSDSVSRSPLERGLPESNHETPRRGVYETAAEAVKAQEAIRGPRSDLWFYHDANGERAGAVVRWDRPDGKIIRPFARIDAGWVMNAMPKPAPLYALPDLADSGTVFVVEGEKCADLARQAGLTATTSVGGAGRASGSDWSPLASRDVVVLPDQGAAGARYADDVVQLVAEAGATSIKVVQLPGLDDGEDIVDFVDRCCGGDLEVAGEKIRQLAAQMDIVSTPVPGAEETIVDGLRGAPRPLSDLPNYVAPEWLWDGYVAVGKMTMLSGFPKAGKSTLLSHVLRDLVTGGPLAGKRLERPVLVVSEESSDLWSLRRDDLKLPGSQIHVWPEPIADRSSFDSWCRMAQTIAERVSGEPRYQLVVLDTLAALWPVEEENSSSETTRSMTVLRQITRAGAGLLLVHHTRKSEGVGGRAARGSSAITGSTDINVELNMLNGDESSTHRTLTARGRLPGIPHEIVLDLGEDGYRVVGSRAQAAAIDRQAEIKSILQAGTGPMTAKQIQAEWPVAQKIGLRTLQGELVHGADRGLWKRFGSGVKGDGYVFAPIGFDSRSNAPTGVRELESAEADSNRGAQGGAE